MKNYIFFALQFVAIISCFGQRNEDPCIRKWCRFPVDLWGHDISLLSYDLDTFISNYVSLEYPDCLSYITPDKSDLIDIPINIRFGDVINFKTSEPNNISINMERELDTISAQADSLELFEFTEDFTMLTKIHNKPYFGHIDVKVNDTIFYIKKINKIEVIIDRDTLMVNHDLFKDLINPNFHYQCKTYRPVEAYYSKSKNLIYIYIYGDLTYPEITYDDQYIKKNTYLCKLIVKPNGETHRIVIPTKYLYYYGWFDCEYFWGF